MNQPLRSWHTLRKELGQRVKRALEELTESWNSALPSPSPVPVPVRDRKSSLHKKFRRYFSTSFGDRCYFRGDHFTSFERRRRHHDCCPIFGIRHGSVKQFFRVGLRLMSGRPSLFAQNFSYYPRASLRDVWQTFNLLTRENVQDIMRQFSVSLRAMILFDKVDPKVPGIHRQTILLQNEDFPLWNSHVLRIRMLRIIEMPQDQPLMKVPASSDETTYNDRFEEYDTIEEEPNSGCYVDFHITKDLSLPDMSLLNESVLDEMLTGLREIEMKIRQLKEDLNFISEFGELPIEYLAESKVIRVHFPNCDMQRVELLLRDKGVSSGVIYEREKKPIDIAQDVYALISHADLLDSVPVSTGCSETQTSYDSEELFTTGNLSSHLPQDIDRLHTDLPVDQPIRINDEYMYEYLY